MNLFFNINNILDCKILILETILLVRYLVTQINVHTIIN